MPTNCDDLNRSYAYKAKLIYYASNEVMTHT